MKQKSIPILRNNFPATTTNLYGKLIRASKESTAAPKLEKI
jgi:hypothetical protein